MKKRLLMLLAFWMFLFLLVGSGCLNPSVRATSENEAELTAKEFVGFMARQEIEKAREISTGLVKYNLYNAKPIAAKAHMVLEIDTKIKAESPDMAIVYTNIETINPLNEVSKHWYMVYLINQNEDWKVYKIEEGDPIIEHKNKNAVISEEDIEEAVLVFQKFCAKIINNNYSGAGSYLIGIAKNNHELVGNILNNTLTTEGPVIIHNAKSIMTGDKVMVLKIEYSLGDKEMVSVVSFYKTSRGWKMYNVSQI